MKRNGFTIAEALVTMLIIGIVASLTIPIFVSNYRKQIYGKTLSVAVSDFENAMSTMIMRDGVTNLFETQAWRSLGSESLNKLTSDEKITDFQKNITKVLPIEKHYANIAGYYGSPLREIDGSVIIGYPENVGFLSKKSFLYAIQISSPSGDSEALSEQEALAKGISLQAEAAIVQIDINGKQKPNIYGRDIFVFLLGDDAKLYPFGSNDVYEKKNNGTGFDPWRKSCVDEDMRIGHTCTARLVENGYKMDY